MLLGNHIFLSVSFPNLKEEHYERQSIKFILSKKKIFSAQSVQNEGLSYFAKIFESDANFEKHKEDDSCVAFTFLHMIEKIYENAIYELIEIREEIDEIEDEIFNEKEYEMVRKYR